jgi:hypothetical protein
MLDLFDSSKPLSSTIKLSLPSEKLEFDSFAELKEYGRIRGRVTNFSLRIAQGSRALTVRTGGLFSSVPTVRVEAESDVWCAGAIEAVLGVIKCNRVWYSWFIYAPINTIFFLLAISPFIASSLFHIIGQLQRPMAFAWLSVLVLLGFLSFTKEKFLPAASISFTNELGFIRRYGSELGLVLGVISIILTVISLI